MPTQTRQQNEQRLTPAMYKAELIDDILLYGFTFTHGEKPQLINITDAEKWLATENQPFNTFVWLHLDLSHHKTMRWMQDNLNLPAEFYESLHEEGSSTYIEQADDHLLALINDVQFDGLQINPSELATLWVAADYRSLITVRKTPLRSIDELRRSIHDNSDFHSSVDLLAELFRHQARVLTRIMRNTNTQVDSIEDGILSGKFNTKRNQLGSIRRMLVRIQRLLAPEPSALFRLINKPPVWIHEHDLNELRQATEEFSTVMRDLVGLQERIKLLQEEIAAFISEQTNRNLFILTGISVLALPVNMTAGLFGMNVLGIPFSEDINGFWHVFYFVMSITLLIAWFGFKRNKQLD